MTILPIRQGADWHQRVISKVKTDPVSDWLRSPLLIANVGPYVYLAEPLTATLAIAAL